VSPTLGQHFGRLIEVSVILCLLVYVYSCLAVWHYAREEELPPQARADLWRYQPTALAAALFCLLVIFRSDTELLALAAVTVFLTGPLYLLMMSRRRSAVTHRNPVG
jgi:arginine:agmatine antiporter